MNIKAGLLILALFISFFSAEKFKKVLCAHSWEAVYVKIIMGTDDPNSALPASEIDSTPPLCGQIITFRENYTCDVVNKGKGMWSDKDKYNWSIDKSGYLIFINKGAQFQYKITLQVLSFNQDSIIFYTSERGIESGISAVTIYKLKKLKVK